jgi:hypothetical protein
MTAGCAAPIAWEELVAYWAGDLADADLDRVDEHLMSCDTCTAASTRVSAITEAMRALIPPFLDHARLAMLQDRGLRITDNVVLPGERRPVVFGRDTDILMHRLGGLDLSGVERVALRLTVEETGDLLIEEPNAPFDRDSGEVLIACQRHFASYPPNIVVEVSAHDASGGARVARYLLPHLYQHASTP